VKQKKAIKRLRGCLKLLDAFCYNLRAEPPNPLKGALTAAFVLKPPLGGLGVKQEGLNKLFDRNLNNLLLLYGFNVSALKGRYGTQRWASPIESDKRQFALHPYDAAHDRNHFYPLSLHQIKIYG
jgi:hypothetical protein